MREILFSHVSKDYQPTLKAHHVRVVINGELWGIYVNSNNLIPFSSRRPLIHPKVRAGKNQPIPKQVQRHGLPWRPPDRLQRFL